MAILYVRETFSRDIWSQSSSTNPRRSVLTNVFSILLQAHDAVSSDACAVRIAESVGAKALLWQAAQWGAQKEGEGVKRLRTVVDAFTDISGIADLIEGSIDINVLRTMTDGEEDVLADEDGSSTAFSSDKAEVRVIKDDRVPGNEWRKRFILPTCVSRLQS